MEPHQTFWSPDLLACVYRYPSSIRKFRFVKFLNLLQVTIRRNQYKQLQHKNNTTFVLINHNATSYF